MGAEATLQNLIRENQSLAAELAEARELLYALRRGEVDALVSSEGEAVYGIQLIALAVDDAESYAEALAIVARKLCEATGFVYAEVWTASSKGSHLEHTSAWHGVCSDAVLLHESLSGLVLDPPDEILVRSSRGRDPLWIHVEELRPSSRRDAIAKCGMRTGLALPFVNGPENLAVFELWRPQARARDDDAIRVAMGVLNQCARFVQRKREQEAMRHTLLLLERTARDRGRQMAKLSSHLSDESATRERAEKLARDRAEEIAQSEQALKKQTALLQSILDSMADGVLVTDPSGRVLQCNPVARKILGDVPAHVSPELWPDICALYREDKVSRITADEMPLAKALRGEATDRVEMFVRPDDRSEGRCIAMSGRPLLDDGGAIYGAVALFHDITERKREEEQRIQRIKHQRNTLLREIQHRIKNNLSVIIELMHQRAPGYPEFGVFLKQIEKQLYAIATMYGVEVSRDAAIRLDHLVRNVSQNTRALFGVPVNAEIAQPSLKALKLREEDSVPVALALNELLVNAGKHGDGGRIEIRVREDGSAVLVEVINASRPDARLPAEHEADGSSGLSLVRALLPRGKATLDVRLAGNRVCARIELAPDIFYPVNDGREASA